MATRAPSRQKEHHGRTSSAIWNQRGARAGGMVTETRSRPREVGQVVRGIPHQVRFMPCHFGKFARQPLRDTLDQAPRAAAALHDLRLGLLHRRDDAVLDLLGTASLVAVVVTVPQVAAHVLHDMHDLPPADQHGPRPGLQHHGPSLNDGFRHRLPLLTGARGRYLNLDLPHLTALGAIYLRPILFSSPYLASSAQVAELAPISLSAAVLLVVKVRTRFTSALQMGNLHVDFHGSE
mmetsp:Transcript_132454/g.423974  ORF Transcript_132454/g.423974 Transcript_132454/m.423974 type:complete len:236 (-) Transcript_132454:302-1009(-)